MLPPPMTDTQSARSAAAPRGWPSRPAPPLPCHAARRHNPRLTIHCNLPAEPHRQGGPDCWRLHRHRAWNRRSPGQGEGRGPLLMCMATGSTSGCLTSRYHRTHFAEGSQAPAPASASLLPDAQAGMRVVGTSRWPERYTQARLPCLCHVAALHTCTPSTQQIVAGRPPACVPLSLCLLVYLRRIVHPPTRTRTLGICASQVGQAVTEGAIRAQLARYPLTAVACGACKRCLQTPLQAHACTRIRATPHAVVGFDLWQLDVTNQTSVDALIQKVKEVGRGAVPASRQAVAMPCHPPDGCPIASMMQHCRLNCPHTLCPAFAEV